MILVKGGTFQMGSPTGMADERPVHTVTVDDFYMDEHLVTQAEWKKIMGENPAYFSGSPKKGESQTKRPIEHISQYDAFVYCNKRSIAEKMGTRSRRTEQRVGQRRMPLGGERLSAPDRIRMGIRGARWRSRRTKKSGQRRRRKSIVEQKQQRLYDPCRVLKIAVRARLLRSFRKRVGMVLGLVRLLYARRIRKPARCRTHSRQHRPHGARRRMECRSVRLLALLQKLRQPRFPL